MNHRKAVVLSLSIALSTLAGTSGIKAQSAAPDAGAKAKAIAPIVQESREVPDCQTYLATPLDGSLIQVDRTFYFVSPKLPGDKMPGSTYLVSVDLTSGKAKRLAGFRGGKSASLLGHGRPLNAISLFDFGGGRPDCGEGKTSATAIQWAEQKVMPSYPAGNYGYVEGDSWGYLADMDKGVIFELDLNTKQKRTLDAFAPGARPLYINASSPLVLYSYNAKTRELSRYINNLKLADATLRLKEGMKLVQQNDKFGVIQAGSDNASLKVSQIKTWSGDETKSFDIKLPVGVSPASLDMNINFEGSQILLFGKDENTRKSLKQVLFYNGKDLTKTYKAPPGTYFSVSRFGADHGIVMLLSDISTNVVRELWWADSAADVKKIDVIKEKVAGAKAK